MNTIYLSNGVNPLFRVYLENLGFHCETVSASPFLSKGIDSHPDLFMCKMGTRSESPVFFGKPSTPKSPYPSDIPYNAVCTGKYFIHRLAATDAALLRVAKEMGMILIDVRQGYAKCNTVVVDENSLITSDKGIFKALTVYDEISCLLVNEGHVSLSGFSTGFLGGASGRVGNMILFHGALNQHPDFFAIKDFIDKRGFHTVWFDAFPLTDIGSIIEMSGLKNMNKESDISTEGAEQ